MVLGNLQTTLGAVPASKRWEGLSAEIEETARHAFNTHDRQLRDLVLVSGMIRIKGLQIASYNVARSLAEHLPGDRIMDAIVSMLVTELEGDIKLGDLAKGVL